MWHRGHRTGPAFLRSPVTGSPELATGSGSNSPKGIGTRRCDRSHLRRNWTHGYVRRASVRVIFDLRASAIASNFQTMSCGNMA